MKRNSGFTLLELMTVVAMLAILVALAAPSFRGFTINNRIIAVNNDLVSALNLARSEATRRSVPVTVCPSTDGLSCGGVTNWVSGWIVFQNPGDAGVVATPTTDILQKWGQATSSTTIGTTSAFIQYQPTGTVTTAALVNISDPACKGQNRRQIQVSAGGMISTQLQLCP